jgi:Protein of unknown function (DUF2971)
MASREALARRVAKPSREPPEHSLPLHGRRRAAGHRQWRGTLGIQRRVPKRRERADHIQQALTYVVSKLDKAYAADIVREFLWVTVDQFERLYIRGMEVFGVCFCENPDLLRQWRGYPASGGGYAIGFDTAAIAAGRFLRPIIYDEEAQRRTLRSLLTTQCELLPQAAKESDDYRKKCLLLAVQIATSSLVDCAFAFKHPKFAEEAEWRLVRVMMREREPPIGGTPLFRVGGTGLLPYTPFDLKSRDGRQPISEIIVGPSPHPDLAVGAARRLLESAGYDAAGMVKRSEIPLRV